MLALLAAEEPSSLLAARWQMAVSLGWHIVLACFGVAFPMLIWVVHRRGIRDGDDVALGLAKRWSKVAAVLFAVGAVSGTILSFEMGLLWPELMRTYGDVIGLPFALEGIAFFIEAIFIGVYLYGWGRLPPKVHLFMLVPIAVSGVVGTFCILPVNAWVNTPAGFRLVHGLVPGVDPGGGEPGLRGDGVLAMAKYGVGLAEGRAGTGQEIFQEACQNHYVTAGVASPMVFYGVRYWTRELPALPLLASLSRGRLYEPMIAASDDVDAIVRFIESHPPVAPPPS